MDHAIGEVWRRIADWCARRSARAIVGLALPLVLAVGALDYLTGREISFGIFYVGPVALATWFGGLRAGIAASAASAAAWYVAEQLNGWTYSHAAIPVWNAIMRGGFFLLIARAFAAIRRSQLQTEERYAILVRGVRDYAILLLDRDGYVSSWNPGAQRIFGYREEEVAGRHFSLFYAPEDASGGKPGRGLKIAAAEGRYEDEGWRVRKDRSRFWAHVVTTPLRDSLGTLRGFAKVVRDVTERRLTLEALRESEERFRMLLDAIEDVAVVLVDPQGRIASWNAGAQRLFGYRSDEIIGAQAARLFAEGGGEREALESRIAAALEVGRASGPATCVARQGAPFAAHATLARMRDEGGRARGVALLVTRAAVPAGRPAGEPAAAAS